MEPESMWDFLDELNVPNSLTITDIMNKYDMFIIDVITIHQKELLTFPSKSHNENLKWAFDFWTLMNTKYIGLPLDRVLLCIDDWRTPELAFMNPSGYKVHADSIEPLRETADTCLFQVLLFTKAGEIGISRMCREIEADGGTSIAYTNDDSLISCGLNVFRGSPSKQQDQSAPAASINTSDPQPTTETESIWDILDEAPLEGTDFYDVIGDADMFIIDLVSVHYPELLNFPSESNKENLAWCSKFWQHINRVYEGIPHHEIIIFVDTWRSPTEKTVFDRLKIENPDVWPFTSYLAPLQETMGECEFIVKFCGKEGGVGVYCLYKAIEEAGKSSVVHSDDEMFVALGMDVFSVQLKMKLGAAPGRFNAKTPRSTQSVARPDDEKADLIPAVSLEAVEDTTIVQPTTESLNLNSQQPTSAKTLVNVLVSRNSSTTRKRTARFMMQSGKVVGSTQVSGRP